MNYRTLRYFYWPGFGHELDSTGTWRIDSGSDSSVYIQRSHLFINSNGHTILWLAKDLPKDFRIRWQQHVPMEGKANDRVADMALIWAAQINLDSAGSAENELSNYPCYVVMIGADHNSRTTLTRVFGNGRSTILREYSSAPKLLYREGPNNKWYSMEIISLGNHLQFWVDRACWFDWVEKSPLKGGHFGFMVSDSRQEITDFCLEEIEPMN